MVGARKTFRAPLWGTIGLVVAGAICVAAGYWQLGRAEQKQRLFATFDTSNTKQTLHDLISDQAAGELRFQRIAVSGHYDADRQVFIDNMTHEGRVGYHVLTPLRVDGKAVLVNRGWIPANPDRSVLPRIPVSADRREIAGRVSPFARPGIRLDGGPPMSSAMPWPRRMLFPTAAELAEQLGYAIHDYQLLLDADAPDGFVRDWRPELMSPDKHRGYAIQWFAIAFTLFIIYVVVNRKEREEIDE
jgi:surfeit locus 1 family protein